MSEIICPRLIQLKTKLNAETENTQSTIMRIMHTIMDAYENTINDITDEECTMLNSIKHDIDNIIHNIVHIKDTLQTIGQPTTVERYFNISNGEVVEVSKENFVGLPDDDEQL